MARNKGLTGLRLNLIPRLQQQLGQLGDIRRDPPRLLSFDPNQTSDQITRVIHSNEPLGGGHEVFAIFPRGCRDDHLHRKTR